MVYREIRALSLSAFNVGDVIEEVEIEWDILVFDEDPSSVGIYNEFSVAATTIGNMKDSRTLVQLHSSVRPSIPVNKVGIMKSMQYYRQHK
jgi:hypothetical protein